MAKHLNVTNREVIRSRKNFHDEAVILLEITKNSSIKSSLKVEMQNGIKQEPQSENGQQLKSTINNGKGIIIKNELCSNGQLELPRNPLNQYFQNFKHQF